MSIIVPATSGHLGRLVVDDLLRRGVPASEIVAGARRPETIAGLADAGVRTARIDYAEPRTIEDALSAGDTFVLISGPELTGRDELHANAISAAGRAGAGHLIYTSMLQAPDSKSGIAQSHAVTEDLIRRSALPFTILRNGWYTENYELSIPAVAATGVLMVSVGDARVASATRQDYAEAIAVVATTDGHTGATYELSGDEAWNYDDLAAALSEVLGRHVAYQPVTDDELRATLLQGGLSEPVADMLVGFDADTRAGALAFRNGDLGRLIGRPTTPLVDGLRPLVPTTAA